MSNYAKIVVMKQFVKTIFLLFFITAFTIGHALAEEGFSNCINEITVNKSRSNAYGIIRLNLGMDNLYNVGAFKMTGQNTYTLTLPGVNCKASPLNNANDVVVSIDVTTRRYNGNNDGYTKITLKTKNPVDIRTSTYILQQSDIKVQNTPQNKPANRPQQTVVNSTQPRNVSANNVSQQQQPNPRPQQTQRANTQTNGANSSPALNTERTPRPPMTTPPPLQNPATDYNKSTKPVPKIEKEQESYSVEKLLVVLGVFLVLLIAIFSYLKARDKLIEISGERVKIEVDDEDEKASKKKKTIKSTVKKLDKKYTNPVKMPVVSEYSQPAPTMSEEKSTDEMNIVDLDELYKAGNQQEQNDALEDFLASYGIESKTEEVSHEEEKDLYKIDEELFNRIINSKNIKFTNEDMECINKILSIEISDEAIENLEKYLPKTPVKKSKKQMLENLVSNYAISQNITFTDDDVKVLDDLANVELDKDFVTDLRTNPDRTREMENEIRRHFEEDMKKPSEVITLKVADLLPDLKDVEANPEKYTDPEPEKVVVDVDALLKNIENVTFKPFDDGSRHFEVLNHFEDEEKEDVIEINSGDFDTENKENLSGETSSEVKIHEEKQPEEKHIESNEFEEKLPEVKPTEIKPKVIVDSQVKNAAKTSKKPASAQETKSPPKEEIKTVSTTAKCHMDGRMYDIISSVKFTEKAGCYLVKDDDGYIVLSYYRNKVSLLKKYKLLKSEKIQARLSEKLNNNVLRYIVRIGNNKFMADFDGSCINFVMDL